MNGLLELLSAPLVRYVATSDEVRRFVERAHDGCEARRAAGWDVSAAALKARGDPGPRCWNRQEDMVLGFWLARAERRGLFRVAWVKINDRSANMGCLSTKGMYGIATQCSPLHAGAHCGAHPWHAGHVRDRHPVLALACSPLRRPPLACRACTGSPPSAPPCMQALTAAPTPIACRYQRPRQDVISVHNLKVRPRARLGWTEVVSPQ